MITPYFAIILLTQFFTGEVIGQYEDEYKDGDNADGGDGDPFEDKFITVTANGEVMPFHFNPAERNITGDTPIKKIPKKKVVGGKESSRGAVPYIINLSLNGQVFCGGSLYNKNTVLTAAHCFHTEFGIYAKHIIDAMVYTAGDFDKSVEEGSEQRRKGTKLTVHPQYNPEFSFSDIAIVTVDKPFQYNEFVQPIPVDRPPVVPEEVGIATISGWGYSQKKKPRESDNPLYYPAKLREANVKVFQKRDCYDFYGSYGKVRPYCDANLIVAGHQQGNQDGCQGDSGGPLACYNPNKQYRRYLCGIVATGVGCGQPGFPGFYTRVAEFHDWVIENAGYADARTKDDTRDPVRL